MNEHKQNIDKLMNGLSTKLTDKIVSASNETVKQNAKADKKCTGLKRKTCSKSCSYCSEHEGEYTSAEVDAGKLGGRHGGCKCTVSPVFEHKANFTLTREMISNKKFGRKARKHAKEFGLDPSNEEDRNKFCAIILDIVNNPEEVVKGTWRDRPQGVTFYIKGNDVVVMEEKQFVTILEDGVNQNGRVKSARRERR